VPIAGPRQWLRDLNARHAPRAPFSDPAGRKGVFTPFCIAPRHRIVRVRLQRPGVAAPWRIALVADLHAGSQSDDARRLPAIMAEVDALAPDLVLLLGDYVNMLAFSGGRIPPRAIASWLRFPSARCGVFAVLGNHDWEYGFAEIAEALESVGVTVLENDVHRVERGGQALDLVGLSDDRMGAPDLALLRRAPGAAPAIAMTHDPALFHDCPPGTLMVAGHMHGGQIAIPGLPPPFVPAGRAPRRWARGHIRENGSDLVVTAGLGCSGLPFRFGVPPDVVLIDLAPGL
jgi:predicted MPP superfamily phosphohydrolase